MKQIFTLFSAFCLTAISQNTFAQTTNVFTTDPAPALGWGMNLVVNSGNGFTSTNTTLVDAFPKNQTTTLTSPEYYYTSDQATIYFKYNFTTAQAGNTTTTPVISILYGAGLSFTAAASSVITVDNGSNDLYFSVTPASLFPAGTNFRISITMSLQASDKAIVANSLTTNAILVGSASPLPVKLISYNGSLNKGKVQLQWNIAENKSAYKFEIERSTNGTNFSTAAVVMASQITGTEKYDYTETSSANIIMYRLKMYDNSGKVEYSRILVFNNATSAKAALQVVTNPVIDKLALSVNNASSEVGQLVIYDVAGHIMQKESVSLSQGINTTLVALNGNFRRGLYFVELTTKSGKLSEKFLNQ